ncbi:MAG TPA: DsbE family thiol:disulfide interchange protein, partial [Rhodobacter sp.]|nr:DsbE family thiol:disulfide interchange protein [Rhodobacter sp.]
MIRPMVILPPVVFMGLAVLFYLGMARSDPDALPSTFIGQL